MPGPAQESISRTWKQDLQGREIRRNGNSKGQSRTASNCFHRDHPSSSSSDPPICGIHLRRAVSPGVRPCPNGLSRIVSSALDLLLRKGLSTLIFLLWNQMLIGPVLSVCAWFWIVWKCASMPFAFLRWISSLFRTGPANGGRKRTVLISGGSTVQAVHLARNFHSAGARVVACEIEGHFGLARFSTAVDKFYTVPRPEGDRAVDYVSALCAIAEKENPSYYVPVSVTSEAVYDALAKPRLELLGCTVFCPPHKEVLFFDDLQQVLNKCRASGLETPSYHRVTSGEEVSRLYDSGLLAAAEHFMANVDPPAMEERLRLRVPPFRGDFRAPREISPRKPWIVVEDPAGEHYVTCTTVKDGFVVGNVTCRSENRGRDLVPVEKKEIVAWIKNFFGQLKLPTVSGHFDFRFVIPSPGGCAIPLDCKVGVSLPYMCYTGVHPRIVWKPCRHFSRQSSGPLVADEPRYWMPDALLFALRHPSVEALSKFVETVLDKREALFAPWDPLPYCAHYHLQLPLRSLVRLLRGTGKRLDGLLPTSVRTPPVL